MRKITATGYKWRNLNDMFEEGGLEVWYMKPGHFRDGITGGKPEAGFLERTHIKLGSVAQGTRSLDDMWVELQGERWSPNGEASDMIRALGLQHTSMSVGDCFRPPNGEVWIVAAAGFEQVR